MEKKRGGPLFTWFAEDFLRACGIDPTRVTRLDLSFTPGDLPTMRVEMLPPGADAHEGIERLLRSYTFIATPVEDERAA